MKKISSILFLTVILINSCKSYYISVDSLKQQFAGIDSMQLKEVRVTSSNSLLYNTYKYKANPIEIIQCTDKKGNPHQIINSPSIETRITYGNKNKKTVFYFDRIYVDTMFVYGVKSRFMEFISGSIPLDSISKIEIQDGRKNFEYVNY